MQVLYAKESLDGGFLSAIFLAGPTPRDEQTPSWRPEALRLLEEGGFSGVVFVPEERDGEWKGDYLDQVTWEQRYRAMADIILFWVPRELTRMPALTTNVEFGEDVTGGKMVYGRPSDAPKNRYLDVLYRQRYEREPCSTLKETVALALSQIGDGAFREGGERHVPLHIWQTAHFQRWYEAQRAVGNRLEDARVLQTTWFSHVHEVFCFQLWVRVWIEAEQRVKRNEFVIGRPDIATVIAWYRPDGVPLEDAQILLVREFRSAVRNSTGFVLEFPGGSEVDATISPREVAAQELAEEAGLQVDPARLRPLGARQLCATLCSHIGHVFALSLSEAEFLQAKASIERGEMWGIAGSSEQISLHFVPLHKLQQEPLDWSMLGMLYAAVSDARRGSG